MNKEKLQSEILDRSVASDWDEAKREWHLELVYELEEAGVCLCGHNPIIECCVLRNRLNNNTAEVGNVCVKKFMGIRSDLVFDCIRRIKMDRTSALNEETVQFCWEQGWITHWELTFSYDTAKKRCPTSKQLAVRLRINQKVLARFAAATAQAKSLKHS